MGPWSGHLRGGMEGMRGGGIIGAIFGLIVFVAVMALLVLAIVWVARQLRHRPAAQLATREPIETAKQRLAAGEITAEQFDEIRTRLQSGAS